MLTNVQLSAVFERLATVAVSYAVGAGFLDAGDAQIWSGLIVAVLSGGYAIYTNRAKRLAERAASAGMTVVAPPQIADASKSPDVVSSAAVAVVPK